jgi:hypothetical protein
VPKNPRFQQRCGETTFYFYAFSLRSVKGKACGSFAASPIFYFLLMKYKTLLQNQTTSLQTAAAAAITFIL